MLYAERRGRTEIGPVQGLVREPDLEPPTLRFLVEFCDSQAGSIDRDGVPNVTIPENRAGLRDG